MKGEPLTILLVEDNPAHAELVMRSFESQRVANKIFHVWDGEEALDYLFRRGNYENPQKCPRPNVVLLDLRLPKIDGLEVLREIKSAEGLKRIPVVILTTSQAEIDASRAYDYHANSYLIKPLDFELFTKLMEELGFYWLGWNYNPWS
ncbi:MAG: response regulator [Deltaproteobacteria bacterium]|nr:response regulator [Deltaproteobacteria bacterium]